MSHERALLVKRLQRLAALVPDDAGEEFWAAFADVLADVLRAFSPPDTVRVGHEHLNMAVSVASAYLDADRDHLLLAGLLYSVEDQMALDPTFRLGVVGALGQLVVDGLTAAVMASSSISGDFDEESIDPELVHEACRTVLQRIALLRRESQ
jgi:hypothetical protein